MKYYMNIIKKLKQLDNNLFNNNIIKNNDTNYIIGFIVALLSSSILNDNIKVPYILECTISKLIFLIIIVSIAKYNFTLSIILAILYTTLHIKSSPNVKESFTFYDADNDGDDDDDEDKPHPDEDPELEKMRLKMQESEEVDRIIDVDDEDNESVSSDTSNTSNDSENDNQCLIKCLKDNRKIDECKHICEDICDCSVKDKPEESGNIDKKNIETKVEKDDSKQSEIKQSEGKQSKDKKTEKEDNVSKEQNNLDRLKKILNDDN